MSNLTQVSVRCGALLLLLAGATLLAGGCARVSPLQIQAGHHGTLLHAQVVPENSDIIGLRTNLGDGWNENVYGLDLGVIDQIHQEGAGIQAGLLTDVGNYTGIQVGAFANLGVQGNRTALQIAGLLNQGGTDLCGGQIAVANWGDGIGGGQVGLFNTAYFTHGFQIGGIYNDSLLVTGAQVGLINDSTHVTGLQIGLINFNTTGFLPVFPGLNFSIRRQSAEVKEFETWR